MLQKIRSFAVDMKFMQYVQFLCMALEGDISQQSCVQNGTNRYSAAVFLAEFVRKYFVLEVRKKISRPSDLLIKTPKYCFKAAINKVNFNGNEHLKGWEFHY